MQRMHLSAIDLNLLVVLDALLATRSTTAAAKRVALSQPATSHALSRLRELFDDPLLVREGRGLSPTPFARELAPRVRAALDAMSVAVARPSAFEPARSARLFTVGAGDYASSVVVPRLAAELARTAPHADLFVKPFGEATAEVLANDEVEVVLGPMPPPDGARFIHRERLFDERFVCVVRPGHPLARSRLTLDRFCAASHVLVAPRGVSREGAVDAELALLGRKRRVAVAVPSFFVAPEVLGQTDYVLTIASRVGLSLADRLGLVVLAAPIDIPGFTIGMHWHARSDHDAAHRFLRDAIRSAARDAGPPPPRLRARRR